MNAEARHVHARPGRLYALTQFRTWVPGIVMTAIGLFMLLVMALWWNSYGWIMVIGIPFAAGLVLGYATDTRTVIIWIVALVILAGVIGALWIMSLAGLLCGAIGAAVLLTPIGVGVLFGALARVFADDRTLRRRPTQTSFCVFLAVAGMLYGESRLPVPDTVEIVQTSRILEADTATAWENLVFYEEVGLEPPPLARIGIPYPISTEGHVDGVGDTKRCLYESGYLVKQTTDYRPGEHFGFDVIEQVGIEDGSVELIDGSFRFEALGPNRTRVTLTTRYKPLLQARPIWRPFERAVVHALHDHVLDYMARHAQGNAALATGGLQP